MDAIGMVEIKDIVQAMTYQSGNIAQSNVYSGGDSSSGNTNINLRNLGMGSTLVLLNGKRTAPANTDNSGNGYVDLSQLVPGIALERVEVVKDGASALYGSDAIAGVVGLHRWKRLPPGRQVSIGLRETSLYHWFDKRIPVHSSGQQHSFFVVERDIGFNVLIQLFEISGCRLEAAWLARVRSARWSHSGGVARSGSHRRRPRGVAP